MNSITKQIIVGVSVAVFSAFVFGTKSLYDDVQDNKAAIEVQTRTSESAHQKLDMILTNQLQISKDIAVLQSNQDHLMKGRINGREETN